MRSSDGTLDRFQSAYDADSNVLFRNNLTDARFGELYAYNANNQLTSFQRGTLSCPGPNSDRSCSRIKAVSIFGVAKADLPNC